MAELPNFLRLTPRADVGGAPVGVQRRGAVPNFSMTCQEDDLWCWAAVTQAVERWRGNVVAQTEIASRHILGIDGVAFCVPPLPGFSQGVCESCREGCGAPHSLSFVLSERGRLTTASNVTPRFADVEAAIDNGRPLPVRIAWDRDSAHFVCVTGYAVDAQGGRRVTVHDPFSPGVGQGPVDDKDMRFETFVSAYRSEAGEGGSADFIYEVR